jgi:hypothetical protein
MNFNSNIVFTILDLRFEVRIIRRILDSTYSIFSLTGENLYSIVVYITYYRPIIILSYIVSYWIRILQN